MSVRGHKTITTRWLVTAVAAIGTAAMVAVLFAFPPEFTSSTWHHVVVLLVVTAAAELISIRVKHGDSAELITMFEIAVGADLVLLPASAAAITSGGGLAIAL